MKIRHAGRQTGEQIELQMTPMIDIVFQLLVFFIMTFKIVVPEGDFNIKMPSAAAREAPPDDAQLPPMFLRLTADADGGLVSPLYLNEQAIDSFDALHTRVLDIIGTDRGPGSAQDTAEIELDFDDHLRWEYVVQAITAVSGHISEDGQTIELIEKIKFAPPK